MVEENIVTIREYSSKVLDNINELKDLPYLKKECFKYDKSKPYKIRPLRDDNVEIENTSYAGIIQLDKIRVHFSTKVKTNLFYMLSFLKDEESFCYDNEVVIDIKEGASFFDILGRMFLNELDAIFKKGFYKKYVRHEENISFLRGKLVIAEQLRNDIKKKAKLYCSYENLTYDNLENQIILRAATLLIPLIRFSEEIKRDLIRYSYLLREDVSLVNVVPGDCDKVHYSRLNDYYETIIQFSKVVLQNYFIRYTYKGAAKGFNFIVNMNKVYEEFITTIIEELVSEENEFKNFVVEKQKKFDSLFREERIITKPDVILRRKDTDDYPMIIDAKYKLQEVNADYYQVAAYALAIPTAKTCCLIYPEAEKEVDTSVLTIDTKRFGHIRPDIKFYTTKVNLYLDDPLEFKDYISKIKEEVKNQLINCL